MPEKREVEKTGAGLTRLHTRSRCFVSTPIQKCIYKVLSDLATDADVEGRRHTESNDWTVNLLPRWRQLHTEVYKSLILADRPQILAPHARTVHGSIV